MDKKEIKKLLRQLSYIEPDDFETRLEYINAKKVAKHTLLEAAGVSDLDEVYQLVYSANQIQFIEDAEKCGLRVDHSYSGRGMYGDTCPAVRVDDMSELTTTARWVWDNMGLGYVMYAQY